MLRGWLILRMMGQRLLLMLLQVRIMGWRVLPLLLTVGAAIVERGTAYGGSDCLTTEAESVATSSQLFISNKSAASATDSVSFRRCCCFCCC